jgi:MSHA biogenesis protein MshL
MMMPRTFAFVLSLFLPWLSGCQNLQPSVAASNTAAELARQQQPTQPTAIQVPAAVSADLLEQPQSLLAQPPTLPRFNVSAVNVELTEFFASLVADSQASVVVHPAISGQISLQLKQVTLPEVLAVVQQIYGFDIRQQGTIYQVLPAQLRTETIAVNYLLLQRIGLSSIAVNSGGVSQDNQNNGNNGNQRNGNFGNNGGNQNNQNSQNGDLANNQQGQQQFNGSTIQSGSTTDFWKDLEKTIQGIIGTTDNRAVVVSPQAGLVTVRAMPAELAAVKSFLAQSEMHLQRQVILEAKIIEVTLSDDYQQGINWQNALASVGNTEFKINTSAGSQGNSISASLGGVTSIGFQNADFGGVISLLETQGDAQVLSSPRVTAINNQKAVIKVGQDEYFVTNITNSTTSTGSDIQNNPSITLQPFFSGIALDVTPQIDQNGQVILHIHPSVTETAEQTKTIQLSNEKVVLPLAQSNIRESDTVIKASNGEIVVIGGLMQTVISDTESGVPGLRSLPLIGNLFMSKSKTEKKKELVILLKPTVVNAGVWQQQLQQSTQQVQDWAQQRP